MSQLVTARGRRWWWAGLIAGALWLTVGTARAEGPSDAFAQQRDRLLAQRTGVVVELGAWTALSLAAATFLLVDPPWFARDASRRDYRRSMGAATLSFAVVNAVFVATALARTSTVRGELTDFSALHHERFTTGNFFAFNAGLDMLYITAGALLHARGTSAIVRGFGAGVMVQGGYLLGYDTSSAMIYRYGGR